ncbi:unnamed protein product [Calicophoron daubneyi]|uniref:N-myc downstream regulated n=1 Tax=Calicophoron daubneyi TaxID=300641 RepID=A0AAV2TQC4_CALDB
MLTKEVIDTKRCGKITVFLQVCCFTFILAAFSAQGPLTYTVTILTVHDLGVNHNELVNFTAHESMDQLLNKCTWVHVLIPGQGDGDPDLPQNYTFPGMQELAEALGEICDALSLKHVVLFGEGAGANILARLAMVREDLVLGAVLIHCTGTTAGITENIRDRLFGWKLNTVGMNPSAESYLLFHRFGSMSEPEDEVELKHTLEGFRKSLRESVNPKNLNRFIMAFMARSNIIEKVDQIRCPVLFLTGSLASHNHTVHKLYNALRASAKNEPNRLKHIELIQLDDVANVLRERPDRVAETLQYFIQGLGLAGGVVSRRMSTTLPPPQARMRSLSMEEYDQPKGVSTCIYDKHRKYSTALGDSGDAEKPQNARI